MTQPLSPYLDKYREWALSHPDKIKKFYSHAMADVAASPAKYKNKPVEFLMQPFFMNASQWQQLEQSTGMMMQLIKKVTDRYISEPSFRSYFGFSPLLEKMILKDPGYRYPAPMSRIDLFYDLKTGHFEFCEINTDGSSGMVEARELQRIIGESPVMSEIGLEPGAIREGELMDSWIQAFLDNYRQWHKGEPSALPSVAIVDIFSGEPPSEFIEFQKAFKNRGCPCVIADARELTLQEGSLKFGDFTIDAVYRRLVTWEMIERSDEIQPLIQAVLQDTVCLIGPVRSQISHNKSFFAILHDEAATGFLNETERAFIRRHVPYTARLNQDNQTLWKHWIDQKDELIIKPEDRYASFGVVAGQDVSIQEWQEKLEEAAKSQYLVQRFCDVPQLPMMVVEDENITFRPFNYLVGCFVYNESFQGPYVRVGSHSIIGSVVECFTVPALVVDETR